MKQIEKGGGCHTRGVCSQRGLQYASYGMCDWVDGRRTRVNVGSTSLVLSLSLCIGCYVNTVVFPTFSLIMCVCLCHIACTVNIDRGYIYLLNKAAELCSATHSGLVGCVWLVYLGCRGPFY